jgi:hypothetical protein
MPRQGASAVQTEAASHNRHAGYTNAPRYDRLPIDMYNERYGAAPRRLHDG